MERVELKKLVKSPYYVREDLGDLSEMIESIRERGVIEPIVVRPKPDGTYEVLAGWRRVEAARKAGLSEISAIVKNVSDREAAIISFIENVQRKDFSDYEKGLLLLKMMKEFGFTEEELARRVGKTKSWVSRHISHAEMLNEIVGQELTRGNLQKIHEITEFQTRVIKQAPEAERGRLLEVLIKRPSISAKGLKAMLKPKAPKEPTLKKLEAWYPIEFLDQIATFLKLIEAKKWRDGVKEFLKLLIEFLEEKGLLAEAKSWVEAKLSSKRF